MSGGAEIKIDPRLTELLVRASDPSNVGAGLETVGQKMVAKAKANAVFTRGYSTGATRRSISMERQGALTIKVGTHTGYSGYPEFGTSRMAAQPYMRPTVEQMAKEAVDTVIKKYMEG